MSHLLALDLAAEVYEPLRQAGERAGKPLERVAVDWPAAAIRQAAPDPVGAFVGAWRSDIDAWPVRYASHSVDRLPGSGSRQLRRPLCL